MFGGRVLRKVSGPKTHEFTGELRKFLREELRGLNSLPNTLTVITSKMMREGKYIKKFGG
jgi:hypothetical protein